MLSYLVVFLAVSGLVAAKPEPGHWEPKPCCAPRYFTVSQSIFTTTVESGSLQVEQIQTEVAYDAISERFSMKIKENFYNGTDRYFMVIEDYRKDEVYFISKHGEKEECNVTTAGGGRFPEECLSEDAKYVSETILGDHDLVVDNWYYADEEEGKHTLKTVQREGCVPVGILARKFNKSGKEVEVVDGRAFDFNLGICDPEKYFKPPEICHKNPPLAKPTPMMLEMQRKARLF